jgi:hypothetical protein
LSLSQCRNRRWQSIAIGHELPRRLAGRAAALPPKAAAQFAIEALKGHIKE